MRIHACTHTCMYRVREVKPNETKISIVHNNNNNNYKTNKIIIESTNNKKHVTLYRSKHTHTHTHTHTQPHTESLGMRQTRTHCTIIIEKTGTV